MRNIIQPDSLSLPPLLKHGTPLFLCTRFATLPAMAPEKLSGKRSPLSPNQSLSLRQRVIASLNKLSDRDTFQIASSDLETLSRNLTQESLSTFLSCIYEIDRDQKSAVKRECAKLLGIIAESHGEKLTSFLPRMVGNIIRRLKDPDSGVRLACVEAIGSMASQITEPSFSVFLKPLFETLVIEQDLNLQIGSALCLSQAIESSPDPEPMQLQRIVPRIVKLLNSQSFKAKPALFSVIGSVVRARGASNRNLLGLLVPPMIESLRSNDWATRKAAAEAFTRMAITEATLLSDFKNSCISSFESCRFDKVKHVRETMNQMLEAWKNVPSASEDAWQFSQTKSLSKGENASDRHYQTESRSSDTQKNVNSNRRSPNSSPAASMRKSSKKSSPSGTTGTLFRKLEGKKAGSEWKIEIAVPRSLPFTKVICNEDLQNGPNGRNCTLSDQGAACKDRQIESNGRSKVEKKGPLYDKNNDEKAAHKLGGLRSASRVVPLQENESIISSTVVSNSTEELKRNCKESDISVICQQLVQIENQQSSLLDLLQRFIGSSQNGMRSLETRVQGLEMALDEISRDLVVSTSRTPNMDTVGNGCCKLPVADFLTSKFWRKTDGGGGGSGRYSCSAGSRFPTCATACSHMTTGRQEGSGATVNMLWEKKRFGRGVLQEAGFVVNPLAEIPPHEA